MDALTKEQHDIMVREKRRVAMTSVIAAVLLTSMKLGVGLWTGSLGILSEALHSGLDLLAAAITFFAIRVADRPPDRDHQFGHGKVENLSALFETILLLITCGWILYEAYSRLSGGDVHIDLNIASFAVIIISIVIDFGRARALTRVAEKYNSQALEADALHFRTDIYSSAVVLVGLLSVSFGFPEGDAISAAIVAIIVVVISMRLGKRTVDALVDRVPEGLNELVSRSVSEIPGVESIRSLRLRSAGANNFINLVIGVQRTTFFDRAHAIVDQVEDRVREVIPRADVIVHAEPVIGVRERLSDSIEMIVRSFGLTAHNIHILWVDEQYLIDFDIEFPAGSEFRQAHKQAVLIEERIRHDLPTVGNVLIHLEVERSAAVHGRDVSASTTPLRTELRNHILRHPAVRSCDAISLYETELGSLVAVLRVGLSADLHLREMHDITDSLESIVRSADQRIGKVFIGSTPE